MHRATSGSKKNTASTKELYAFWAGGAVIISKAGARELNLFGVKTSFVLTVHTGRTYGARSDFGNLYGCDTLREQLEQTTLLTDTTANTALVNLVHRGAYGHRYSEGIKITLMFQLLLCQ